MGDTIKGTLTFTLTEPTKLKCLFVKAKGDANVHWSEGTGDKRRSHTAHRRFFKTKEYLIVENAEGTCLPQGDHRYEFQLQIPNGNMPPSFKGFYGKICYVLEAKMTRSWHSASKAQEGLQFVSRSFLLTDQTPQAGSVNKELGVFSKGQLHMSATVNKKVCSPGDTLTVTAKITNHTSKKMRVKFSVEQKIVYRANASAKIEHRTLCKVVGDPIAPDFEGIVTSPVTIPTDTIYNIHNCEIINVEHYIKTYLDISFAIDPEVVFPLIIVPAALAAQLAENRGLPTYPAGAIGGPSYSDFPNPAPGSYPVPNEYAYPPPMPNVYPNISSGSNNQIPYQPTPYGFPETQPFMAYPVAPQVTPMNPQVPQEEAPPSYMSLFPPSQS